MMMQRLYDKLQAKVLWRLRDVDKRIAELERKEKFWEERFRWLDVSSITTLETQFKDHEAWASTHEHPHQHPHEEEWDPPGLFHF